LKRKGKKNGAGDKKEGFFEIYPGKVSEEGYGVGEKEGVHKGSVNGGIKGRRERR